MFPHLKRLHIKQQPAWFGLSSALWWTGGWLAFVQVLLSWFWEVRLGCANCFWKIKTLYLSVRGCTLMCLCATWAVMSRMCSTCVLLFSGFAQGQQVTVSLLTLLTVNQRAIVSIPLTHACSSRPKVKVYNVKKNQGNTFRISFRNDCEIFKWLSADPGSAVILRSCSVKQRWRQQHTPVCQSHV